MASGRGYWGTVLRRLQDLERSQWWAEERIAEYQVVRLQQLVSHAGRAVPFYRARFRQIGLEPGDIRSLGEFAGIPPLTRQEVRANLADLVAEGWQGRVQENSTGGSCGQPVRFFIDAGESALRAAMAARHNRWAGWDLGARAGVIWGAPRDLAGRQPIRERLAARLLTPTLSFNAFDVTPAQLARFAVTLRDWRAEVLFGYAAALAEFARALQNSGETTSSLRTIVSSAEALTPQNRGLIEEATGCPIFDRYGARETGLIASECEVRRGMHVACEDVYVEVESPAPGESGRVLVTKLNSFGMPFIRYDIGDMGYWERVECPCGRCLPLLRLVGCRATDFLVAADGRLVSGAALTLVTRDLPELGTVQLHQSALGRVEVRIEGGGVLPEETADEVRRRLTTYLGPVTVEFAYPARIERTQSGKYRFTVCEVRPEPAAVSKHFGFLD
jgi:phenylacetate-CoA ligase